jgi:hypothetical protein
LTIEIGDKVILTEVGLKKLVHIDNRKLMKNKLFQIYKIKNLKEFYVARIGLYDDTKITTPLERKYFRKANPNEIKTFDIQKIFIK